jgi:hypothetical protein
MQLSYWNVSEQFSFQFTLWTCFMQVTDSSGGSDVDLFAVGTRTRFVWQKLCGVVFRRYSVRISVRLPVIKADVFL